MGLVTHFSIGCILCLDFAFIVRCWPLQDVRMAGARCLLTSAGCHSKSSHIKIFHLVNVSWLEKIYMVGLCKEMKLWTRACPGVIYAKVGCRFQELSLRLVPLYQACEMRVPSENSNTSYSLVTFLKMNCLFLHNKKRRNKFDSYHLCIHSRQISKPSTVTLMLPNASKSYISQIQAVSNSKFFINILSKTMLNNTLPTCCVVKHNITEGK